uniref:3-ketoacyl-CoA thiolase 2 n=1 Tax=Rhizophora mucronata TaxID=61149 RepID=A0A2P2MA20_RHIMU
MSSSTNPADFTAAGIATAGPIPITAGSTPAAAKLLNTPRIGSPFCIAMLLFIRSTAPAPSLT